MQGKWIAGMIVGAAAAAGAAMYYLQVYYYYDPVPAAQLEIRLTPRSGEAGPLPAAAVEAIDAASSPIRFRACFETPVPLAELRARYEAYPAAEPLTAPGWFSCFDAAAIGAALEDGTATAFLGERDIRYGIDRVVAVTQGGQGYAWHQINPCGETVFDGEPAPEGCPPPPEE
ncbi:DUF6446 family protein [Mangrovicoccus algicola]|uniref:Histidine kinase n=1 Tax=Mangrovicoccus algicola TaxID=2771008 RepID=A0A8J6YSY9_9RHOB|nr:DUF6446 family protein [Mangrovicoccus algicola]MBE3636877.1 histidine kinase [Mangrovicoccus algicola]